MPQSLSWSALASCAVELPRHSAHVVHANGTRIARSKSELAATAMIILHIGSSVLAFIGLLGGLLALGSYPVAGVLMTLAAMALLLYSIAVLCGAYSK